MDFDTKAEILDPVETIDAAGNVTVSYTSLGFIWLKDRLISSKVLLTAAREASQLENVFDARWHSAVQANRYLRLVETPTQVHLIVRAEEVTRRRGWVIYTKLTPV